VTLHSYTVNTTILSTFSAQPPFSLAITLYFFMYYRLPVVGRWFYIFFTQVKEDIMIEYTLEPYELNGNPNDFRAQVTNLRSFTQKDIVDRIMKIGAGLTRSDVVSVMEAEKQVVAEIIADGAAVNTDLFYASPSIQGIFTATAEPDAHTVRINLHPGMVLRKAIEGVKTKRLPGGGTGNHIISAVIDAVTGEVNMGLTIGGIITVQGHKIKITGEDTAPEVGLYFKNTADGVETKYAGAFGDNTASRIMLITPPIAPGTYHIVVKTKYSGGAGDLKTMRTIEFSTDLTVKAVNP
jgi:hypothetical protein